MVSHKFRVDSWPHLIWKKLGLYISGDVKKNVSSAIGTEDENIYLNYILGQLGTCRGLYTFFSKGKHQGARCSLHP